MPVQSTPLGVGARGDGTRHISKTTDIIGKPWTLIGVYYLRAALAGNWIAGVCEQPGGSGGWDRQVGRNGSNPAVLIFDGSTKIANVTAFSMTTEKPYAVVGVCDGRTLRAACNGVQGDSVSVNNVGFSGYATPEFNVGYSSNSEISSEYYSPLVALLPYADQNYVDLSANPWQIFKPHRARIYSFPSGAGPSFKAAWAKGSNVILGVA